jgi:hypothetical protein
MATITINYTANYLGDHRICYRRVGDTLYCCLTDTVAALGPQTFVIDFTSAPDYCFGTAEEVPVPVVSDCTANYEGYIQPTCEDIASLNNRTAFTADFTTVPTCLRYSIGCDETGIDQIVVVLNGTLYNTIPAITISGAGGATYTVHMYVPSNGATIVAGGAGSGAGYTNGDVLTVAGGVGTAAQITVNTVDGGGGITSYTVTTLGDYTTLPVDPVAVAGGSGAGATFNLTYSVLSVEVTAPGTYNTSVPTVTFDAPGGGGVTATGFAVMLPCQSLDPPTCGIKSDDGTPNPGLTIQLEYLTSANFCKVGAAPAPPGYTVGINVLNTVCCDCVLLTMSAISGIVPFVFYTDPVTKDFMYLDNGGVGFSGPGPIVTAIPAISGSWGVAPGYSGNVDIVVGAAC